MVVHGCWCADEKNFNKRPDVGTPRVDDVGMADPILSPHTLLFEWKNKSLLLNWRYAVAMR